MSGLRALWRLPLTVLVGLLGWDPAPRRATYDRGWFVGFTRGLATGSLITALILFHYHPW